ncbi:MAG TPA: phenylalanine--tRNA ligase subunit alpha [Nitrososphaeraceae archaeon]|nr:phenylalanine--tRNA ligase subunit alpha [Nitrososphaeraceae archaeon]
MVDNTPQLHIIEKLLLERVANSDRISIEKLFESSGLSADQVRRGIEWLKFKKLIASIDKLRAVISLGTNGFEACKKGLPERRLVNAIKNGNDSVDSVLKGGFLKPDEINAAIAIAKRNHWIQFTQLQNGDKKILLTTEADFLSSEEKLLQKLVKLNNSIDISELSSEETQAIELLRRRPRYIVEDERKYSEIILLEGGRRLAQAIRTTDDFERKLTPEMILSGKWKNARFSSLDVTAHVPYLYAGRQHPLTDIIDEVKEIFFSMGFTEIDGTVIQASFWNFDVLFIPQDHPAREMQDTFYIAGAKQNEFANPDQIQNVSSMHENGWKSNWNIEDARRLVLRTHTTSATIGYLANNKPQSARVFSIGRVFRNEKVSYKHLLEFNQVEGIVTDEHVTLRDLMGLQKEFYSKLGIKKIKFWPTFFPYTEPSLQSMIYNDALDKWVEMGGMGIFRPEVTNPLGIKNPVLAWGLGIERIAMLRFGLNDVRDLYGNELGWLRDLPKCQL